MTRRAWVCAAVGALIAACGEPAQVQDAGVDAGVDAGHVDAGRQDAGTPDAGTADAGTEVCTRAVQTATADIALLDQLRKDVAAATTQQQLDALTQAFFEAVAEGGGTPLTSRGGERVAFIAREAPQAQYSVGGSFNQWTAGADVLERVGQSNVWAKEKPLPRSGPHEYKMVDGQNWYEDRRARHVVWDALDRSGPGEFNAVVYPELRDASKGRLVAWRGVQSATLGDARDVFVYVPPTYDDGTCRSLPSLYFHDGNESLTRSPFTVAADQTYMAYPGEAALLVFVALPDQSVRMSQYTFGTADAKGDEYVLFLRDELRPKIDEAFRTCPSPRDRGLSGASLGGLISAHGAFSHPDVFGYVGSQSGSYFWESDAMITRVANEEKKALRWYLDHGCPNDNCEPNRRLVTELNAKGYELRHIEEAGGLHVWSYWQKRLPQVLRYFREGRQGCAP